MQSNDRHIPYVRSVKREIVLPLPQACGQLFVRRGTTNFSSFSVFNFYLILVSFVNTKPEETFNLMFKFCLLVLTFFISVGAAKDQRSL